MFTSIYALERVIGANIWLISCIVCLIITFIIAFSIKANRIKTNSIISVIGIVLSEIICDSVWFLMYFPNGEYVNMGLASISGLLLYPIFLAVGVAVVSMINHSRITK